MTGHVRFDDALPRMANLAQQSFGAKITSEGLFLRDADGRLTLVLRGDGVNPIARQQFDTAVAKVLGKYTDLPSATAEELFDFSLNNPNIGLFEPISGIEGLRGVKLLDRRIIGQDWNSPSLDFGVDVPIVTFFSCKGGVGRTTALAIAASALSEAGYNAVIVDLDLEAPGIGSILLTEGDMPEYGVLDYLVEQDMNPRTRNFLESCLAPSPLTGGRGLVEVMPAVGRRSQMNPQNVLPKLGRAFIERPNGDGDGEALGFAGQVQRLMREIAARGRSDVILVDARAGLSEGSAAAVVGLGGTVLMFGVDTPQTFECYRYLFAQLNRYALDNEANDWRFGLQMVHAKAARGVESYEGFRDQCLNLFSEYLYEEADPSDFMGFNFDVDDDAAPHFAWPIPFDAEFAEFNPKARADQLSRAFFDRSFGAFVEKLLRIVRTEQALRS